ncbi:flagellar assembly protein FliH [Escherichia coli]
MTIETLRGRYRLHRFPPRQRAVTGEPLTASISAADYQRQLMDGFQEGLQKGFAQGMTEGQEQGFSEGHQQGFAEGRRQGYTEGSLAGQQEGRKQFVEAAQPLEAITGKVNDFLAHIERKQREDLLQLVEKVTRQVIRCELALQPTQLLALVEEALAAFPEEKAHDILIGESWLGRVVNGLGEPLDGKGRLNGNDLLPPLPPSVNPLTRRSVDEPLDVGVKAINGLLTIGKGQRVGLMAGSGVGKSVLLGMITRQTKADIVVVGLIGERGREVKEFIDHSLGADGLAKSIVVVAPADESPLMRLKATELCHSIAAWFRDRGHHVLLLVDSLTRYAMAQREIALSLGEPPATKGYPPSAFGMIPKLVESAGNSESAGSMTAIYTVLAEGDDQQDPIVDCARAVLDGHIVLTRKLAEAGHYPAIDIGQSISRCMNQVTSLEHQQSARALKQNYAAYMEIKPLIPLGGYVAGADASVDKAVKMFPAIERFLRQEMREPASLELVQSRLQILFPCAKKAEQ